MCLETERAGWFREITLRRVLADTTNVSRELSGLFRGQLLGQQGYVKDN